MRYKDFYVRITPDKYIPRVDKKGNIILCEGFLIQVRYWRTALRRRCSLRRILWSVRGRNVCEICGTNKNAMKIGFIISRFSCLICRNMS